MPNEKHVTKSQLDQLRTQDHLERVEQRRQRWRSLMTLAGWAALLSLIGAAVFGLLSRIADILHIGPK